MRLFSTVILLYTFICPIINSPMTISINSTEASYPLQLPNISPFLNITGIVPSRPMILPYHFKVPHTDTVLNLGFGIIRRKIDPANLGALLSVSQDYINQQIENHGAHAVYPFAAGQTFVKSLGDGIYIAIWNLGFQYAFTWGLLGNVIEGLWLYLAEGGRPWQCWFEFRNSVGGAMGGGEIVTDGADELNVS